MSSLTRIVNESNASLALSVWSNSNHWKFSSRYPKEVPPWKVARRAAISATVVLPRDFGMIEAVRLSESRPVTGVMRTRMRPENWTEPSLSE